ncbi:MULTISPECIES: Hsp33 family molecular chaperone HslO [Halorhodospira]|uniref:Hsp33 family molecular chaperone HslO n=1 Tax=Halorhodospira TaxID=85108 RepID=UPI0019123E36|nr:Hsp33 family molecular chaperone [Halorhodospira halophila]MCG5540675.1 Hsp33 family molecular chaperone HslO [Halorhodospira sp. M39old]MCG5545998.1 Hsp33 family molecular chaperone HslO [Halorhodospira sp. M38]
MSDASQRFIFENADVRGEIVQLDQVFAAVREHHDYPPAVARLLGEAMAAAALMCATIRSDGVLSLQVEGGEGAAVSMLLAQVDASDGTLRGTARYEGEPARGGLAELCAGGRLAITIEPEEGQRYQGVVGIDDGGLAATLEAYFRDSEQLPTRLHLACDGRRAGGLLLQRLPASGGTQPTEADPDAWDRIGYLAETLTDRELLERPAHDVLHRLFHQETVRVFEPRTLAFRCRCSAGRIASILRGLGREEVEQVLAEEGVVEVRCQFCGATYSYDRVDVAQVLSDANAAPGSDSYH